MPAISKIRLTNIVYEDGGKRFNDEVFTFDGENSAIVLENGGGKTVLIHTVLQAILPHTDLGERKIKETLQLENAPAHIGIEWVINEHPRRYLTSAVSLFLHNNKLTSHRYVFEYEENHPEKLTEMPFIRETNQQKRPAYKEEIAEYYSTMKQKTHNARTFDTIRSFHEYVEANYQLIHHEWQSIVKINQDEGGIEAFFANCKTTTDLFDRLLIPTVEDSIAGHEKGMFADMFEKQREGFQTYRNLQKSMEEHRKIQIELEDYVTEFEVYEQTQQKYIQIKQRAKGLMEKLYTEQSDTNKELEQIQQEQASLQKEETDLQRHTASFDIVKSKQHAADLEAAYQQQLLQYEEEKEALEKNEHLQASLTYASYRKDKQSYLAQRQQYETELKQQDDNETSSDYERKLEQVQKALHGFFMTKIEALNKSIEAERFQLQPLETQQQAHQQEKQKLQSAVAEKHQQMNHIAGQLAAKQDQIGKIRQSVLANPNQENIADKYAAWLDNLQTLESQLMQTNKDKKDLHHKLSDLQEKLETQQHAYTEQDYHVRDLQRDQQEMEKAEAALKAQLVTIKQGWQAYEDLYLKETTIGSSLYDMAQRRAKSHEQALYKERIAHRFLDDYGDMDDFFADAYLSEKINDWQNQLYMITGPEYVYDLDEAHQAQVKTYPLWALSLITTAADKDKLIQKMTEIKEQLQFPIQVLTLEEAKQINEETTINNWIAPGHFETNLNPVDFSNWKAQVNEKASDMTALRKEKADELSEINSVIQAYEQFFKTYPKSEKDQLMENMQAAKQEKENMEQAIKQLKTDIHTTETAIKKAESKLANDEEVKNGLTANVEKANTYFQIEKEVAADTAKQSELQQHTSGLEKEITQLVRTMERYQFDMDDINQQITALSQEVKIIQASTDYQAVQTYQPIFTNQEKSVLLEEKETLTYKLRGIQQQYGEIVVKLKQAEKDAERMEREMQALLEDHETIDMDMTFPADGVIVLQRTKALVTSGREKTAKRLQKTNEANEKYIKAETRTTMKEEQFALDFPKQMIADFDIDTAEIPIFLEDWTERLQTRNTYIEESSVRIQKEMDHIQKAIQTLEKYEVAHHFKSTTLTTIELSEKELINFPYERIDFTKQITQSLEDAQQQLKQAGERIEQEKSQFHSFCERHITEHKLQKMAMDGVSIKQSYEDVLAFRQHMMTFVKRADDYARDYIMRNDKEIQAFINSIHNHLLNVTTQLRAIPKNTRVKVGENKWKEIFSFTIPEWTEEEGKERIRNYLDWILEQLETDTFQNDSGKARKEIENWLDTKQLLQYVMDNQSMKVSCRKVTNNNQVTSRLTSWEQSNKWSGGEKWSKNMTLFLGILNFVAEKKQHITASHARHRAVILDNPFGKASSDHVLNPVFFIAEQLGFQMIALTAHADGKFLQDYFPVIFSCRLRETDDEAVQVMTKEKNLTTAYFQDHEPEKMHRLEEREQLELF